MVRFSKDNFEVQIEIAQRAATLAHALNVHYTMTDALMDLGAAHHSCPLKLTELRDADDSNFAHDVFGIRRHINRKTGILEDCFLPRFSA